MSLKWQYMEWMVKGRHKMTGQVRWPSLTLLCQWVLDVWAVIPESLVVKSFNKCSISNALYGTEDDWSSGDASSDACDRH
ncbi:hypothetical protein PR048_008606 [Dryococelus australis]|uniref:Uncharacterized protein n=1 Tax=Dryococelus australis TaxID=614101 RepID=A0ABQ9HXK9_9NEOP|nr:hypothetical protein PR048_008606 [Dryococelus australis]